MYVKIVSSRGYCNVNQGYFNQEGTTILKTIVLFGLVVFLGVFGSLFRVHFANLLTKLICIHVQLTERILVYLKLVHININ